MSCVFAWCVLTARGKATDKVAQFGHERLSTFAVGAAVSETQWRAVLRGATPYDVYAASGTGSPLSTSAS